MLGILIIFCYVLAPLTVLLYIANRAESDRRNFQIQIKSSLHSPYYAEACNELQGPSPRLSAWATQLQRNVATVASRWRHCADLTRPGLKPQTSRTDSVLLATELTAGLEEILCLRFFIIYMRREVSFFLN